MSPRIVFGSLLVGALSAPISATVIYDATNLATPSAAPWSWVAGGGGGTVTGPSAGSIFTKLNTTGLMAAQQGWFQFSPANLDNTAGYDIIFDLRVNQETHTSNDRAGISLILLGSNHHGVELSFWTDQVWNQNDSPIFTHGEFAVHDTTAAGNGIGKLQQYEYHVSGGNYTLSQQGTFLFGGALRDYSNFGTPYTLSNYLWVGDDTHEGSVDADFSFMTVNTVPEPMTLAALAIGAIAFGRRRKKA